MSAAPLKVLVVDDEPPIRKLLRMGLGTQGYQTVDASSAKAALELISDKPDLVILDLGLPDMQGLELLRQIRARREDLPIVVLSSRGDEPPKSRHSISVPTIMSPNPSAWRSCWRACGRHSGTSCRCRA